MGPVASKDSVAEITTIRKGIGHGVLSPVSNGQPESSADGSVAIRDKDSWNPEDSHPGIRFRGLERVVFLRRQLDEECREAPVRC
ncbi:hypothetical protein CEXT_734671 [Caerostris extrusa]|uniref:Uncharacterized protein n=1 Tax=Caerostris extrusa TaxID=172846 RepID=A0AAV4U2N9_CAEEX|nr:hypothetical protein CEXT_734671 [Caerostris extrusa]